MQSKFEAPEVKLVGQASEIVMGFTPGGEDAPFQSAPDFEFEHDSL